MNAARFTLIPFSDLKVGTSPPYLVKGLIPRSGLTVVWGPLKCGKSFWTFDVAMHVAIGMEYRCRRVEKGAVVYVRTQSGHGRSCLADTAWQRMIENFAIC